MTNGFFRDVQLPSHAMDHHAHEQFLLDTYAERRAPDASARPGAARHWLRSVLQRAKRA